MKAKDLIDYSELIFYDKKRNHYFKLECLEDDVEDGFEDIQYATVLCKSKRIYRKDNE